MSSSSICTLSYFLTETAYVDTITFSSDLRESQRQLSASEQQRLGQLESTNNTYESDLAEMKEKLQKAKAVSKGWDDSDRAADLKHRVETVHQTARSSVQRGTCVRAQCGPSFSSATLRLAQKLIRDFAFAD